MVLEEDTENKNSTLYLRRFLMNASETLTLNVADLRCADQGRAPRLRIPNRSLTIEMTLDDLIGPEHLVRLLWQFVCEHLDTQPLLDDIQAVQGVPGRNATLPDLLVALWIYAILDGVTCSRRLERLTVESAPYRWLCGGVSVNYGLLNRFRTAHQDWLGEQLAHVVWLLQEQGLCSFDEPMGQDGMRTRAWAGSHSFRSANRLKQLHQEAQSTAFEPAEQATPAQQAAQQRARREKLERLQAAREAVEQVAQAKEKRKKGDGIHARASTTDPESRKMKMADGGTRPGYNVQFATLLGSLVIVGCLVSHLGSDAGQLEPMAVQLEQAYEQMPGTVCADGGFSSKENITAMADRGVIYYSPLKEEEKQLAAGKDPYEAKKGDSAAQRDWRQRMGTPEGQASIRQRCKCELPNAWCRNRGLTQFVVRGQQKVETVAKWYALSYNVQRYLRLSQAQKELGQAA